MSSREVSVRPLTIRGEVVSQWDAYLPARPTYGDWRDQETWPGRRAGRGRMGALVVAALLFVVMVVGSAVAALVGMVY